MDAPNPFELRTALIESFRWRTSRARRCVGIPQCGRPERPHSRGSRPSPPSSGSSVELLKLRQPARSRTGEQLCNSFDSCGPAKIAHAVCDTEIELLLFPKIYEIADTRGYGRQTCVTEQALPELIEQSLKSARQERSRSCARGSLSRRASTAPRSRRAMEAIAGSLGVDPQKDPQAIQGRGARPDGVRGGARAHRRRRSPTREATTVPCVLVVREAACHLRPCHQRQHPAAAAPERGHGDSDGLLSHRSRYAGVPQGLLGRRQPGAAGGGVRPRDGATSFRSSSHPSAAGPPPSASRSSRRCSRATRTRFWRATGTAARPVSLRAFRHSCNRSGSSEPRTARTTCPTTASCCRTSIQRGAWAGPSIPIRATCC